jgi:DNA-binding NtrC family response regulator
MNRHNKSVNGGVMLAECEKRESVARTHGASRLLLVDDDPALLEALAGTLEIRLGHFTLDTCLTGMRALECAAATRYDLIIVDVNMPEMDGLHLLRNLKMAYPDTLVLMISGHADEALIAEAVRMGADDFITKPIDRDLFLRSVRQALKVSRLRSLQE